MTEEQGKLLEKARRSLDVAKRLDSEGDRDFAVSRAYYGMFYAATAMLKSLGLSYKKHSAVVAAFGERFAATGSVPSHFHRYLIDGQEDRTIGDYLTDDMPDHDIAVRHIAHAEEFIAMAEQFLRT
jgi:uncharacterized protein (UPF0332 family)